MGSERLMEPHFIAHKTKNARRNRPSLANKFCSVHVGHALIISFIDQLYNINIFFMLPPDWERPDQSAING